jgi:glutamyl-tRNA synthetase
MVKEQKKLSEKVLISIESGALQNASRHGGKADVGAVIGRVLAEFPELRSDPGKVARAATEAVARVNALSPSQRATALAERGTEPPPTRREGRVGLPPLKDAVKGKAVFRLPPEPSGFMTIGHGMAFSINYEYRLAYDGELWLRFEDTNPRKVAPRYYESFRSGISWLGIAWDHEKNVSDDIELIYQHGESLIRKGGAYACSCDADKVKRLRFDGKPCEHRDLPVDKNLRVWFELLAKKHREGEYVVRFKGDMRNVNYSLRDPNLFRVIDQPHPLTGTRYALWPTYDVANAVEDEICGVTHVLRSSEFRNELQQLIRDALGFRRIEVIQFSRFNFKGTPVGKRLLRPLVEEGLVSGWDDPRMPTIEGVKRRGILPEAIRRFTLQVGYTKTEHEYDWSLLYAVNRRLLDPVSRRLFFVPRPVRLSVAGAPSLRTAIPYHPDKDLGERAFETEGAFYVPGADLASLEAGTVFRLMDLYNVRLDSKGAEAAGTFAGTEVVEGTKKLQWVVPGSPEAKVVQVGPLFDDAGEFSRSSLLTVEGMVERSAESAKAGEVVQFPRFGFCRLDSPGSWIMAHR